MCGIAGFLSQSSPTNDGEWETILSAMGGALRHRGPNDQGVWLDRQRGVGLVHRRLSVIDLSPAGHQPMLSPSGRYVIVFNGEIYNHRALRKQLDSDFARQEWRGESDTETLLAYIEHHGPEAALAKIKGMFAFALWDRQEGMLTLARDRLGEKPLYYGWQGNAFLFCSDVSALKHHPEFRAEIDRAGLSGLIHSGVIPAPKSIYKGVYKLAPGSYLKVSLAERSITPVHYWDVHSVTAMGRDQPFTGSRIDAAVRLETLLRHSIKEQMVADVPLGALLSGGIDSSTVVALMQSESSRPVKTFTIGFHESGYDEAVHAKAVARHLGTEHTELYLTPEQALKVIATLPDVYSEPFADSSQIPTILVCQLARQSVTVALSGDGGDELLGGYTRYLMGKKLWRVLRYQPMLLRRLIASGILSFTPQSLNNLAKVLKGVAPSWFDHSNLGDKLHKATPLLTSTSPQELYHRLVRLWPDSDELVIGTSPSSDQRIDPADELNRLGFMSWMMLKEMTGYLPDDILTKVDRAAMSVSLETRIPLLDRDLVAFARSLPESYLIGNGVGKWPLRQVLEKYVPRTLTDRPKMGFGMPVDRWLRGPLRPWAESLLDPVRLRREGFLQPGPILRKWEEHLSGRRNWHAHLWPVLMFQQWLERQAV